MTFFLLLKLSTCKPELVNQHFHVSPLTARSHPLGIASGLIKNDKITASSYSGSGNEPWMARLNAVPDTKAWCAAPSDSSPYLQVDLGRVVVATKIAVAGKSGRGMVTTFKLSSSSDGGFWRKYTTVDGEKVTNTEQY